VIEFAQKTKLFARRSSAHASLYEDLTRLLSELDAEILNLAGDGSSEQMESELSRIIMSGGKRLRPTLAFLCYKIGRGHGSWDCAQDDGHILPLMVMLELMHTASLVHDDVVDDALLRRDTPTINAAVDNSFAVKSGDFLLAKAMTKLHYYRGTGINETLADVSEAMCLGELQQQRTAFDLDAQSEYLYLLQIKRKTATLLAASCYCGALAAGMSKDDAEALWHFGERFGTAFQMVDDFMDCIGPASSAGTGVGGKAPGQDIRSGIFTLPILLLKETFPDRIRAMLESKEKSDEDVQIIMEYVKNTDALELTKNRISRLADEACEALEAFPASPAKDALVQLVNSIVKFSK
jgi:geranylgeranyl pyrophosphate synthase